MEAVREKGKANLNVHESRIHNRKVPGDSDVPKQKQKDDLVSYFTKIHQAKKLKRAQKCTYLVLIIQMWNS